MKRTYRVSYERVFNVNEQYPNFPTKSELDAIPTTEYINVYAKSITHAQDVACEKLNEIAERSEYPKRFEYQIVFVSPYALTRK